MTTANIKLTNIEKIQNLLTDKNVGFLVEDGQLEGEQEQFGGLVTIGWLRKEITPLLEAIALDKGK